MPEGRVIALALTWDGTRWPVRGLPAVARAFLNGKSGKMSVPAANSLPKLFASNQVKEIRVCWVPRMKGGDGVLSEPFQTVAGRRLAFRSVRMTRFGDILGVVYRRLLKEPIIVTGSPAGGSLTL